MLLTLLKNANKLNCIVSDRCFNKLVNEESYDNNIACYYYK